MLEILFDKAFLENIRRNVDNKKINNRHFFEPMSYFLESIRAFEYYRKIYFYFRDITFLINISP